MSVRLFTLGVLYEKDSYGYEIKEIARLWGLPRWADIQEGSIYYAIKRLESEGLIREQRVEQTEKNLHRYLYRITDAGETTFLSLLRETCRSAPVERRDIDIALAFLDFLEPAERVTLLQERQEKLQMTCAELKERQIRTHQHYPDLHPWVEAGVHHSMGRLEFEIEWNRSLLEIVESWPLRHRKA